MIRVSDREIDTEEVWGRGWNAYQAGHRLHG